MKTLVALCPYVAYRNEQLLKDCVLIPYSFTNLGYQVKLVTAKKEELTYLKYLPKLEVDYAPLLPREQWADYLVDYLKNYQGKIDRLFCFGLYPDYGKAINYFKQHFDGQVILKLDANPYWMDIINYQESPQQDMIKACDLISCEGRAMQSYLAKKWKRPIDLIRNGFPIKTFNPELSFDIKENIILNVGRQDENKNTKVLVSTFAKLAASFPDWQLVLVGSYDPNFEFLVKSYQHQNPYLKRQIKLVGPVADKAKLENYYARAKVFALSSYSEGSPNVIGEALRNGCYIITSKISVWQDTFAKGAGASFDHGDLAALEANMRQVMSEPQLSQRAFELNRAYALAELPYEKQVLRLESLLKVRGQINGK
ncbi:hypothetical protein SY212_20400 [Ligilactobacillus agilis]|uniref:Glycosyl transferase family 1 domain-containing protein n=3 Tax=Ligilactobacillus agilis TaxID=1601 RepID=A0A6F9XPC5_9LACO|nr:glycosyltransferase family 4 protein [Ligilactobacillus agilis]GET07010.1 hypothetical protein SY212_20400 [Ligilactobacillus agilis]